jgi:hypothetical protein
MASNARSGSWRGAPAGQPASDDVTGEIRVIADAGDNAGAGDVTGEIRVVADAEDDTGAGDVTGEIRVVPDAGLGQGVVGSDASAVETSLGFDEDEDSDDGTSSQDGSAPGWPVPHPATRADGWDADSTAAWDTASAWAAEDAEGPDSTGGSREEAPDWEGEIVKWEAQPPEVVPGQLVPTDWSASDWAGAPTAPPGSGSEYVPAHLSPGNEAVAVYTGRGALPAPPIGPVYDRKGARRTKRENGPWRELVIITAVAVIVSAVILAVTTAEKSNVAGLNSLFGSPGTTAGAASRPPPTAAGVATDHPSAVSSTAPNSQTALTSASKGATPATLSQQAKSLPVTPGVANSLLSSWLASNPGGYGMGPTDVDGTVSNEVYYAVQPATGTYWALAAFKPSPTLKAQSSTQIGQEELAQFHDSVYAFSWQAGPVWTLLGEFSTGSCPGVWVPRAVLAAWRLCGL